MYHAFLDNDISDDNISHYMLHAHVMIQRMMVQVQTLPARHPVYVLWAEGVGAQKMSSSSPDDSSLLLGSSIRG